MGSLSSWRVPVCSCFPLTEAISYLPTILAALLWLLSRSAPGNENCTQYSRLGQTVDYCSSTKNIFCFVLTFLSWQFLILCMTSDRCWALSWCFQRTFYSDPQVLLLYGNGQEVMNLHVKLRVFCYVHRFTWSLLKSFQVLLQFPVIEQGMQKSFSGLWFPDSSAPLRLFHKFWKYLPQSFLYLSGFMACVHVSVFTAWLVVFTCFRAGGWVFSSGWLLGRFLPQSQPWHNPFFPRWEVSATVLSTGCYPADHMYSPTDFSV